VIDGTKKIMGKGKVVKQKEDLPKRRCEVCGGEETKSLWSQAFSSISDGGLLSGYDVVVCKGCGFGFADHIPSQAAFDAYYREASKYENDHRGGEESGFDRERFHDIAFLIRKYIPSKYAHILDVGSATGGMLAMLRKEGFRNLTGLDPSPTCAESAMRIHNIHVLTGTLSQLARSGETFDFLVLVGILEHVSDLTKSIAQISELLSPGGRVYLEVPDATRFGNWPDAPFQQFSTEHINFFSKTSLTNLVRAHGFTDVFIGQDAREQSHGTIAPVVTAIYQKGGAPSGKTAHDDQTERGLAEYIQRSKTLDEEIGCAVSEIAASRKPIIVWGVGPHAQRLMATGSLSKANIISFVDSNAKFHGKDLNGVPIIGPEDLQGREEAILIASRTFQHEIQSQIRDELGLKNELILLYPV
jgi:SAM-dependent methyltransferase